MGSGVFSLACSDLDLAELEQNQQLSWCGRVCVWSCVYVYMYVMNAFRSNNLSRNKKGYFNLDCHRYISNSHVPTVCPDGCRY